MSTEYSEQQIEQDIQAKRLNAPRLSPLVLDDAIVSEQYYVFPGTTTTVCCLTLRNGFTVLGDSACASPENFDEKIGRKIARAEARDKIWNLEGYLLKERLHNASLGDGPQGSSLAGRGEMPAVPEASV